MLLKSDFLIVVSSKSPVLINKIQKKYPEFTEYHADNLD